MMAKIPGVDVENNTNQTSDHDMLGFEIDHPTPQMGPVAPTSSQWELAVLAAKLAAVCNDTKGGGAPLKFKHLVKVTIQLVAGVIYYLTFTAVDLNDNVEKVYRAKVWATVPDAYLEFIFCREFKDSKESAKQMREKISAIIAKLPKKYRQWNNPSIRKRRRVKVDGQEQRGGFKEIREQNPSWKYVRVQKVASKKWRPMSLMEKMPYINKARKKFFLDRGSKTSDFC